MAVDQEKELAAPIKAQRLAYGPPGTGFDMSVAFLRVVERKFCAEGQFGAMPTWRQ